MPDYRWSRAEGETYLFTVNLRDRRSDLVVAKTDCIPGPQARSRHLATRGLGTRFTVIRTMPVKLWLPASAGVKV